MDEGKFLGKPTKYPKQYAPEVLVPVPRHLNRQQYGLRDESLPFVGVDVWHAYELSFLTQNGLPVTGLLKVVYSADSPFLVESKSLKLYLNSLNMERFGASPREGVKMVLDIIHRDLEEVLKTSINLHFFTNQPCHQFDFAEYVFLEDLDGMERAVYSQFTEDPGLLITDSELSNTGLKVATNLLRSNCKVTFQPDWGSAFIFFKGAEMPDKTGLLKYLVSIRNENHFHEEICEMIFKRLWDRFSPDQLMVACIYTRRGGIDICPVRASHPDLLPQYLGDAHCLTDKLLRQ
ncbi:NADPH-dependent 7-cyano-7-deazaguanine reductase QueF [Thermophagus sp. OGC60D27]|uniref:NADPH-dependent 7-cyano-7-deazaguanine reductase QueF n=1 Tax=Thermophagus sp. OGC60D27 TaxID=3458415 RepID=UPI004037A55A